MISWVKANAMDKIYKLLKILFKRLFVIPITFILIVIVLLIGGFNDLFEDDDE